jgi:cell division septum initiation protein DivIVA
MADRNDASSSMITPTGATGRVDSTTDRDRGYNGSVVTEFLDAARSAAESLLDEQKRQIADRISGVARALRSAAEPLDESQSRVIARYLEEGAAQVHNFSRTMRERHWGELVADSEDFARRQPTWFVLGAVATGFVVGRLLWTSIGGRRHDAARSSRSSEPARTVTAAISSGSGTAAGELTGNPHPITGAVETR